MAVIFVAKTSAEAHSVSSARWQMARQIERITVAPLTPEQRHQMRETLKRIIRFREAFLAERGGQPFGPASEDIAAIREERERDLP